MALPEQLDELAVEVWRSSERLATEVQWPIELALDIALCYPKGPNPLPPGTWRGLAQTAGLRLIVQAGAGVPGSRLAAIALRLLEASSALARRDSKLATKNLETAAEELAELGPEDLLSSAWERHGYESDRNGHGSPIGLPLEPSGPAIRPAELAEA